MQINVARHRGHRDVETAGKLRGVQEPALAVGQHGPESPQRLRRHPHPELRDVALQVRANEVASPAGTGRVAPGGEGVGEAATNPQRLASGSDLQRVQTGQLLVDDAPCQRLRRLPEQRIRSRPEEEELPGAATPATALVDLAAEHLKESPARAGSRPGSPGARRAIRDSAPDPRDGRHRGDSRGRDTPCPASAPRCRGRAWSCRSDAGRAGPRLASRGGTAGFVCLHLRSNTLANLTIIVKKARFYCSCHWMLAVHSTSRRKPSQDPTAEHRGWSSKSPSWHRDACEAALAGDPAGIGRDSPRRGDGQTKGRHDTVANARERFVRCPRSSCRPAGSLRFAELAASPGSHAEGRGHRHRDL